MKKAVFIIAQNDFRDEELSQPKEILEKSGIAVTVASTTAGYARGAGGAKVKPDILVKDINARDFDAVVFIGGMGASQYVDDPIAHQLIRQAYDANKIVAAICISPVILAKAGILKGKRATVSSYYAQDLKKEGAIYTARPVEKDGNIVTGSGPSASGEFGEELIKALTYR